MHSMDRIDGIVIFTYVRVRSIHFKECCAV